MKGAWYLPDKYLETRKDRSNSDWSALLIIIWCDDGVIWHDDDMTNRSWWSSCYSGIRHDVMLVLSSNHFSSQQLNNHPTNLYLFLQACQCSTAVLSNLPVGWTLSLGRFPKDLEGTTCLDNRCRSKSGLRLIEDWSVHPRFMTWSLPTSLGPRSLRLLEWMTTCGFKPSSTTKSWRGSEDKNRPILIRDFFGGSLGWE